MHPIAYGLKAFGVGGHGLTAQVSTANPDAINLTAHAVRQPHDLFVTVVNKKDPGARPRDASVTIASTGFQRAAVMFLAASNGDPAAKTGITLGGASIGKGAWEGTWTPLATESGGRSTVLVPGASAAIVRLSLARR